MIEPEERDGVRLQHMVGAMRLIEQFCQGRSFNEFEKDELFQSAVVRQFEVLGEASNGISEKIKLECPDIPWRQMQRFRNFLIHEYFRIDSAQVWETIQYELPKVKSQIEKITIKR